MSNHPIPDSSMEHMMEMWGTRYLITDPKSDYYLKLNEKKSVKSENNGIVKRSK